MHHTGQQSGTGSLLEILLREQQELTAVEQFSRAHSAGTLPDQAQYYSRLLPATSPGEGQQYAFEVDLDRCSGCKACVTACHSLNGLDEEETWRDVGLLIGGSTTNPVMQHVTTACHHCLDPACMTACPVDAYEKDPITGIVKHLDDQCFGCQYCTLACPYDVPKYHAGKGIVRKCDMCSDRLAVGEAPACVQACPHEAIAIKIVDVATVQENSETDLFLPGAPEPYITLPTTTYKTKRVFPRNMLPADYNSVNPQHPHWPLIIMLVLTQLSVGAAAVGMLLEEAVAPGLIYSFRPFHATMSLVFGLLALASSTMHLGRPQYAFRAIIGLRHSWLSREILAFGLFAFAATIYALISWKSTTPEWVLTLSGWTVVLTGYLGLFCSVMIYVFTEKDFWSFSQTASKFMLTSVILGLATTTVSVLGLASVGNSVMAQQIWHEMGPLMLQGLIAASALKLFYEALLLRHLWTRRNTPLKRSARLTVGALSNNSLARVATGLLGGILMPLFLLSQSSSEQSSQLTQLVTLGILFIATLAGELLERYQFFAAVSSRRMPGGPRP